MATLRDYLNNLFSSKLIVTNTSSGMLKVVDFNQLQSREITTNYRSKPKWRVNKFVSGYGSAYGQQAEIEALRKNMYLDYEGMDADPIISSALDIYADESTTNNEHGDLLQIITQNERIKKMLHNLFHDILNIEFNLWKWVRSSCKYGDFFLLLDIKPGYGIVNATPVHPNVMMRLDGYEDEEGNVKTIFRVDDVVKNELHKHEYDVFEVAHFRLGTDPNFEPYGKSIIEGARKEFKKLSLLEDALLLHRIMRAPERRIFKIDVGNIAPEEVDGYIEEIAATMKKVPYIDPRTGEYDLKFNVKNMMEDIFLPTRGGDSGTEVDTLDGLNNDGQIEDVEYSRNKVMAALKIPKAYLGYEEGVEGKATLAAEDIRFARTIERVQKIMVSELYKIALIHLYVQGIEKEHLIEFSLSLNNPSMVYERQMIDLLSEKVDLVATIKEKRLFSRKWIYENIFNMTITEWQNDQDQIVEDLKREFREEQIASEGNDPAITGESRGTPHDLASMAMASNPSKEDIKKLYQEDGRVNNPGRPKKLGSFGRHKDQAWGRDPDGRKGATALSNFSFEQLDKYRETEKILTEKVSKIEKGIQDLEDTNDNILND